MFGSTGERAPGESTRGREERRIEGGREVAWTGTHKVYDSVVSWLLGRRQKPSPLADRLS